MTMIHDAGRAEVIPSLSITERPALCERERGTRAAMGRDPAPYPPPCNADRYDLAAAHLAMAVPLRVARFVRAGGPTDFDRQAVRGYAQDIAEAGDDLLYGGPQTAELMTKLVEAVALLSFQPGGVHIAGLHFETA